MKHFIGSYPRVRVQDDGRQIVSQTGSVLLVETVRKTGLDRVVSQALAPWRKPRAVHDPGKALLDVALAVALGGDCLADLAMLRCEAGVFGPVASDPTISRLIDTLAASGEKALQAIRSARSEVRCRAWSLAGKNAPDAAGCRTGYRIPRCTTNGDTCGPRHQSCCQVCGDIVKTCRVHPVGGVAGAAHAAADTDTR